MRVLVLLNAAAGTLAASQTSDEGEQVRRRFASHGVEAEVRAVEGAKLPTTARAARDDGSWDMIVAGGGDGTLNAVGAELVGSGVTFAVLPLGTFNHLAKELELPADLDEAVDALVTGRTVDFNVGQVNGRVFLLFSAIGMYSDAVWHRDAQRKALGRTKWRATIVAYWKMLARWPLMRVGVRLAGQTFRRLTPAVYVGVSEYQLKFMGVETSGCGGRSSLNVFLAASTSRRGMVWMMLKGALRLLRPRKDFEVLCTNELEVSMRRRNARVGVDGEVFNLETPLKFRLIERGLQMRVPAEKLPPAQVTD